MRAFLALDLTDEVKARIAEVQEQLRQVLPRQGVRFVRPDKMHLTLLFMGQIEPEAVEAIRASLSLPLEESSSFEFEVRDFGVFPSRHRPAVLWLGIDDLSGELARLQGRVEEACRSFVERPESRPYSPHITLARISPPSQKVGRLIAPMLDLSSDLSFGVVVAYSVVLFESIGGEYKEVFRVPLSKNPAL